LEERVSRKERAWGQERNSTCSGRVYKIEIEEAIKMIQKKG
jgi:hypothetical protein